MVDSCRPHTHVGRLRMYGGAPMSDKRKIVIILLLVIGAAVILMLWGQYEGAHVWPVIPPSM